MNQNQRSLKHFRMVSISSLLLVISFHLVIFSSLTSALSSEIGSSSSSRSDLFKSTRLTLCYPDSVGLECPTGTHLLPVAITLTREEDSHNLPTSSSHSPSCGRSHLVTGVGKNRRRFANNDVKLASCFDDRPMQAQFHKQCNGQTFCQLTVEHLLTNKDRFDCLQVPVALDLEYKCLPDPGNAVDEAICADTYMDLNCDADLPGKSLVIQKAQLTKQIPSDPMCPSLLQSPQGHQTSCEQPIDVTSILKSTCDSRPSCSVNSNLRELRQLTRPKCGKWHLVLSYICVPSQILNAKPDEHFDPDPVVELEPVTSSPRSGPKHLHPSNNPTSSSIVNNAPSNLPFGQAVRDIRQSDRKAKSNKPTESKTYQKSNRRTNSNTKSSGALPSASNPVTIQSDSVSNLKSIYIGIGMGSLVVLLSVIIIIIACRKPGRRSKRTGKHLELAGEKCHHHNHQLWRASSRVPSTCLACSNCTTPLPPPSSSGSQLGGTTPLQGHQHQLEYDQQRFGPSSSVMQNSCYHHYLHGNNSRQQLMLQDQQQVKLWTSQMPPSALASASPEVSQLTGANSNFGLSAYSSEPIGVDLLQTRCNDQHSSNSSGSFRVGPNPTTNPLHSTNYPINAPYLNNTNNDSIGQLDHKMAPTIFANNSSSSRSPSLMARGCDGGSGNSDPISETGGLLARRTFHPPPSTVYAQPPADCDDFYAPPSTASDHYHHRAVYVTGSGLYQRPGQESYSPTTVARSPIESGLLDPTLTNHGADNFGLSTFNTLAKDKRSAMLNNNDARLRTGCSSPEDLTEPLIEPPSSFRTFHPDVPDGDFSQDPLPPAPPELSNFNALKPRSRQAYHVDFSM